MASKHKLHSKNFTGSLVTAKNATLITVEVVGLKKVELKMDRCGSNRDKKWRDRNQLENILVENASFNYRLFLFFRLAKKFLFHIGSR